MEAKSVAQVTPKAEGFHKELLPVGKGLGMLMAGAIVKDKAAAAEIVLESCRLIVKAKLPLA
jgi:pantoate kinase